MILDLLSDSAYNFARNLRAQDLLLQVAVVLVCSALGWMLARLVRRFFVVEDVTQPVMQIGLRSFSQVLTPLLILVLLVVTKLILVKSQLPVSVVHLAIPLMASLGLMRFVFYALRRIFVRDSGVSAFLLLFEKLFGALVWAGVLLYITGLWPDVIDYLHGTVIPIGKHQVSLLDISQALLSVLFTLLIALWAGSVLEQRLMRMNTMHSSLRTVVARMGRAFLILVALMLSLSLVGIDLTVLSVFGGALGVALGLGLQKIASSYVSGFVILLERSLAIGDMVGVSTYYGKVTQINSRFTILEGLDGVESIVPNDVFMTNAVQNYSLNHRILRLATHITIVYQEDVEKILFLLEQATSVIERVTHDIMPQAVLLKIGQDGLEIEVGFWILDPENGRLNVLSDVNRAIWRVLQKHNIKVAQPRRDLRMVAEDAVGADSQQVAKIDDDQTLPNPKRTP
ncbi:mechanosensitive ion channel family protein [Glaciimonas soli]|uniref:Mechanosensitive ion channel n=1 Tax=Glaciimonas soli TaxID=2590999 RepID=A0A843YQI3_9BURK|nr:mechanosensitive ion channel domain-containing protein [Glaciimonas soli]MQR02029.1 mechanosensitive ion channel [Glaciimonas soli]